MVVDTPHGEFEVKDITRKERRKYYKKVKQVLSNNQTEEVNLESLHELGDDFVILAFGNEKNAEKALGSLSVVEEDVVINSIISAYMGTNLGNPSGD